MANEIAANLEADIAAAVKAGKVPHAVVYATNADGSFQYHHASGFQHYGVDEEPIQENPVLLLASMTKLLTSIAMLKLVEEGFIGLDDDILPHLPELAGKKIITGFDESDQPILHERKNPMTIRHLLTHTSGLDYGAFNPLITKWQKQFVPEPDFRTVASLFSQPLIFEPGATWWYGPNHDFAGILLHRLTGEDLDTFSAKRLWKPMGLTDITFWPARADPSLEPRIPTLVARDPASGALAPATGPNINTRSEEAFGGQGGYASPKAFLAVLRSLLANDGKLLRPESVEELFRPQLDEAGVEAMKHFREFGAAMVPGEHPTQGPNGYIPLDHGLGGMVFMEDGEGRRKKGTLSWSGMTNPMWLIDREADLALVFGTQVLPSGDPGCKEVSGIVERGVYKLAGKA